MAVTYRLLTAVSRVHTEVSLFRICDGKSGRGTEFCLNSLVFLCQYHATTFPYSFMCHLGDWYWACQQPQFHWDMLSSHCNSKFSLLCYNNSQVKSWKCIQYLTPYPESLGPKALGIVRICCISKLQNFNSDKINNNCVEICLNYNSQFFSGK